MSAKQWLLYTDLHLEEKSEQLIRDEVLPGILAAAIENKCQRIVCLGDVYNIRYRVLVRLQNLLMEHIHAALHAGFEYHLLPGNHDQIDPQGRNALEVFSKLEGVYVHSEPEITDDNTVAWMPYRLDADNIKNHLRAIGSTGASWLFMHGAIKGALQNNTMVDAEGLSPEAFDEYGFHRILLGHYHKPQALADGKIIYLGSPYQTRADEAGQDKYIYLFNPKDGALRGLPVRWGKRYVKVSVTNVAELKQIVDSAGVNDDLRITLAAGMDMKAAHKLMGNLTFTLTPTVQDFQQRLHVGAEATLDQYVDAYLKQTPFPENVTVEQLRASLSNIKHEAEVLDLL